MANPLGPLGPADERLDHQVADTFATVGTSDPSWTEKVCAMAARRDGSLQLGFGMGKYLNRNVLDGYAGLSRGVEQITVRGSRRLFPCPDETSVGPIRYEVLEPMQRVRFALDPNPCQPLAFDWTFESALPPATEERTHQRAPLGYRVSADLVRYHQIGTASGWVEIDGQRHAIEDRAMGVHPRPQLGRPLRRRATTDRCRSLQSGVGDGLPDDLVAGPDDRPRWHPVGVVHAPGRYQRVRPPPPHGDRCGRARGRAGRADGGHPARPCLRPVQPASARGLGGGGHGGRNPSDLRARGAHCHRLPPGRRPVLRVAGPPPRRMARRAPRRWGAPGGLQPAGDGP